jgi:hypothetical protein
MEKILSISKINSVLFGTGIENVKLINEESFALINIASHCKPLQAIASWKPTPS